MPRPKPTVDDIKARKSLAKEIKVFRKTYKVTQRALADLMREPGDDSVAGCRRTLQMIESAKVTPHKSTLLRLQIVKNRIEAEHGG
jgi:transcriptional regulator with XRE-family HTH domain